MDLTGKEIKALAEFAGFVIEHQSKMDGDLLETQITVNEEEGQKVAHYTEYPEEGCITLHNF